MFQIPPALWPEIEDSVMRLLLDAYDAGMRRGLGSGRAPSPEPTVEWLLRETARRWDEQQEALRAVNEAAEREPLHSDGPGRG